MAETLESVERFEQRDLAALRHRIRSRMYAAILVGGMVGALVRAGLETAFPWDGHSWPWVTFVVNLAGTALLGYLATRLLERLAPSTHRRPFLCTGLCGSLTTFSTFQVELVTLGRNGELGLAAGYGLASLGLGLLGVYLATALTRRVRRK